MTDSSQALQAAIVEYKASAASYGVDQPFAQHTLEYEVALQLGLDYQVLPCSSYTFDQIMRSEPCNL